jgi:hypothetical protein
MKQRANRALHLTLATVIALEVGAVNGTVTLRGILDEVDKKSEAVDGVEEVIDLIEVADPVKARPKP